MQLYDNWIPKLEYSFGTTAQGILPLQYSNVTLTASGTYDMATIFGGQAIYAQWRRIYPFLDETIIDDPEQYLWLCFKASNGERITLANPWIESSSVRQVSFRQEIITLTETNESQIARVKDFLNASNFKYTSVPVV